MRIFNISQISKRFFIFAGTYSTAQRQFVIVTGSKDQIFWEGNKIWRNLKTQFELIVNRIWRFRQILVSPISVLHNIWTLSNSK